MDIIARFSDRANIKTVEILLNKHMAFPTSWSLVAVRHLSGSYITLGEKCDGGQGPFERSLSKATPGCCHFRPVVFILEK
jgi:hypothetical protein